MKLVRAIRPKVLDLLRPYLLPDPDRDIDSLTGIIESWMRHEKDNTYVLVGLSDDENSLYGFLIAYAPPHARHVFILQAWASPDAPPHMTDIAFLRLLHWTDTIGRKEIRLETARVEEGFQRRWGFEKISTIMGVVIDDRFEAKLSQIMNRSQETDNGNAKQSVDNVDTDTKTADDKLGHREVPQREHQEGSDTVLGTASSSAQSGLRSSAESDKQLQSESVLRSDELSSGERTIGDSEIHSETGGPDELLAEFGIESDDAPIQLSDRTTDSGRV